MNMNGDWKTWGRCLDNPDIQPLRERTSMWASFKIEGYQHQIKCIHHLSCYPAFVRRQSQGQPSEWEREVEVKWRSQWWGQKNCLFYSFSSGLKYGKLIIYIKNRAWKVAIFRRSKLQNLHDTQETWLTNYAFKCIYF